MNIAVILSGIITFINYVPKLVDLVEKFYNIWIERQVNQSQNDELQLDIERDVLIRAISKAETKHDRRELSKILHILNNR